MVTRPPPSLAPPEGYPNHVAVLRVARGYSQAELALRAGLSIRTIVYVENGTQCTPPTKRAILLALGKTYQERNEVFPNE